MVHSNTTASCTSLTNSNICPHCKLLFNSQRKLLKHVADVHNRVFSDFCHLCTVCCSGAYSDIDLEMHMFQEHGLTTYKCMLCLTVAHKIYEIVDHFSDIHKDLGDVTFYKLLKFIKQPLSISFAKSLQDIGLDGNVDIFKEQSAAVYECSIALSSKDFDSISMDSRQLLCPQSTVAGKCESHIAGTGDIVSVCKVPSIAISELVEKSRVEESTEPKISCQPVDHNASLTTCSTAPVQKGFVSKLRNNMNAEHVPSTSTDKIIQSDILMSQLNNKKKPSTSTMDRDKQNISPSASNKTIADGCHFHSKSVPDRIDIKEESSDIESVTSLHSAFGVESDDESFFNPLKSYTQSNGNGSSVNKCSALPLQILQQLDEPAQDYTSIIQPTILRHNSHAEKVQSTSADKVVRSDVLTLKLNNVKNSFTCQMDSDRQNTSQSTSHVAVAAGCNFHSKSVPQIIDVNKESSDVDSATRMRLAFGEMSDDEGLVLSQQTLQQLDKVAQQSVSTQNLNSTTRVTINKNSKTNDKENSAVEIEQNILSQSYQLKVGKRKLMYSPKHSVRSTKIAKSTTFNGINKSLQFSGNSEQQPPRWQPIYTYIMNFENLPHTAKRFLTAKRLPFKRERIEFVNALVSDLISHYGLFPGRKIISGICQQVVDLYPDSFAQEDKNGFPSGLGSMSLTLFVENRMNNEKRKRVKQKMSDDESYNLSSYEQNSEPEQLNTQDFQELEKIKVELQQLSLNGEANMEIVRNKMLSTYKLQRNDVDTSNNVTNIIKMWPYLFLDFVCLNSHFSLLIGVENELIISFMANPATGYNIYTYFQRKKVCDQSKKIMKIVNRACDMQNSIWPAASGAFPLLVFAFREPLDDLIRFYEDGATVSNIDDDNTLPRHPLMAALSTSVVAKDVWYVVVDKKRVNSDPFKDVLQAMTYLFMMFYTLNIDFPKTLANYYQFFQSYLIRMPLRNPQDPKKKVTPKQRVLTFISRLMEFNL